jgi:hypothetical protein
VLHNEFVAWKLQWHNELFTRQRLCSVMQSLCLQYGICTLQYIIWYEDAMQCVLREANVEEMKGAHPDTGYHSTNALIHIPTHTVLSHHNQFLLGLIVPPQAALFGSNKGLWDTIFMLGLYGLWDLETQSRGWSSYSTYQINLASSSAPPRILVALPGYPVPPIREDQTRDENGSPTNLRH